jgi:LDH2 family malate/lactate/ureidoglycolate dehydrogenase
MKVARKQLSDLVERILTREGVPPEHARIQASLFIGAQMRGTASHGLLRLRRIVERLKLGLAVAGEEGRQDWTAQSFLSVDGRRGLGPVVALKALDAVIPRARQTGIAIAAVRNANHLGALAYYADHVARQGLTVIALTISEALVHPFGGRTAMIGTNPIAIGVPAEPEPLVLDMATSLVSMGKIHDHANRGAAIPEGWALDEAGNPTTDAMAAKDGAIAPFGGAKGYALGLAFEVLVASLAESAIGRGVKGTLDAEFPSNKGDLFIVIAPPHAEAAKALVTEYLDAVRASPPADAARPVLIPGDRAHAAYDLSKAEGVTLDDGLWQDLQKLDSENVKGMIG